MVQLPKVNYFVTEKTFYTKLMLDLTPKDLDLVN